LYKQITALFWTIYGFYKFSAFAVPGKLIFTPNFHRTSTHNRRIWEPAW